MAKKCAICGKGRQVGNKVSHSGRKSKKVWQPNLQKLNIVLDGKSQNSRVCTSCLKSGKVKRR